MRNFKTDQRVSHPEFGPGTVMMTGMSGNAEMVWVKFDKGFPMSGIIPDLRAFDAHHNLLEPEGAARHLGVDREGIDAALKILEREMDAMRGNQRQRETWYRLNLVVDHLKKLRQER